MAHEYSRAQRIGDQLQRELAVLIQRDMNDPRVRFVTLSAVDVSRDLSYADVFFTLMSASELTQDSKEVKDILKVLTNASGFLRNGLGKTVQLRVVPHLRFHFDQSVGRGRYLSSLIDQAVSEDNARHDAKHTVDNSADSNKNLGS